MGNFCLFLWTVFMIFAHFSVVYFVLSLQLKFLTTFRISTLSLISCKYFLPVCLLTLFMVSYHLKDLYLYKVKFISFIDSRFWVICLKTLNYCLRSWPYWR
jgi:hypothetical protein